MPRNEAKCYEDCMKIRKAKVGDIVTLSDGSEKKITKLDKTRFDMPNYHEK